MGNQKPKVCKCGHSKDLHIKHKKFPIPTNCQSCPCTDWMNRQRPDIVDKICACLGIGASGFIALTTLFLIISFPKEGWNYKVMVPITGGAAILLLVGLSIIMICIFTSNIILPYWIAKKRKSYPEAE